MRVLAGGAQYCVIFLLEFDQVPIVNRGEKSPRASCRGRGKGTFLKYWEHSVLLTRSALGGN